ncbi:type II CRISPR RNA-guided endonuclease Cas9 [Rhodobacter capsulatus]|uniref:type II CRISPR RNA-guided endonuclease Cas9 n=1 Tax=Rhodobacter capsulatus TaxID=1061 RepID=UPI0003D331B5|nr:type II CRISPR RNA-guided endonuclease Cas9 [Rhodobacter capsulatus]ETD86393.1 CRISPR-associated protein [Rhodobacter capsulatus B6]
MFLRLGLDIGTNSIGWWLFELNGPETNSEIIRSVDGGVRIFSDGRDPKSGASLAVDRRAARAMRRRRDRYLRRRASLMKALAASGLMPVKPVEAKALELLDPYELRAKGLDEKLELTALGRALFHINQRRGFKSNRKTDRGDNESGKIKDASARLDWAMREAEARTYGEFLHKRRAKAPDPRHTPGVRTRLSIAARGGPDSKAEPGYDFYPDRRHLEAEFHTLWDAQAEYYPEVLTRALRDLVFEKIFYQRPLREPEVGLCLFTSEKRIPKAHPLAQRRTLYETVNQLRITADGRSSRPLTRDQRDIVILALDTKAPTKSLTSMNVSLTALGKLLKLSDGERFTLETEMRDAIACDPVRASLSHPERFGPKWVSLGWEAQWEVIERIRAVQSDAEHQALVDWLVKNHKLDKAHAERVASAPLPEGYGRLGLSATQRLLDHLQSDVMTYSDAVAACGWHHSSERTGECLDRLPYYGEVLDRHVIPGTYDEKDDEITRYGRITNPTVHIGLNQLRRLVNRIIETYGKPTQIVVELARELKQSEAQKREVIKRIQDTTAAAKKRSEKLQEQGCPDNGHNRMLLRLWEELGPAIGPRCCPYTGTPINVSMVLNGECDVDHILPFSRTLDDSVANRTLCLKEANREKGNHSPWEAWGDTPRWAVIEGNLKNLPENKRWRFAPDAMRRFEDEGDFLDRALVDTQYLARISRSYLDTLFTEGGHVWVVPGRLTEMLRRHWGLNALLSDAEQGAAKAKNRTDHRHHAIDAAVVAATDRSLLNRISKASGQGEAAGQTAELVARNTPAPWEGFRKDIESQLDRIVVSHRADHGRIDREGRKNGRDSTAGQLHNDTAYGVVDAGTVVSRVPLLSLSAADIVTGSRGKNIRDPQLQRMLEVATRGKEGKALEAALRDFAAKPGPYQGIRRVRLIEALQQSARVEVGSRPDGRPLKAYKGDSNHCYDLWRLPDGKVVPQVVTTFEAHSLPDKRPHPAAKRILRVFKRDMVVLERNGKTEVFYVLRMHVNNGLYLAPHREANADARSRNKDDPFRLLQIGAGPMVKAGIRRVFVDEMGRLKDPTASKKQLLE